MVKSLHFIFQIWVKGENCRRNVKKEVGNIEAGSCSSELQTKVNCEPVCIRIYFLQFTLFNCRLKVICKNILGLAGQHMAWQFFTIILLLQLTSYMILPDPSKMSTTMKNDIQMNYILILHFSCSNSTLCPCSKILTKMLSEKEVKEDSKRFEENFCRLILPKHELHQLEKLALSHEVVRN